MCEVPAKRNVPAIRFIEYTEDYSRTTLGKIGNTYNGLTGKSAEDFGQGSPYITYKSIFDNSRVDISRVEYVQISDIEQRNKKQNKVAIGDIFFTTSSETPEEVGMTSILLDNIEDCYLNSFCFGYRVYSQEQYLPEYLRFYLRSSIIRKKLFVLAQGSTRFNLSKNEVMRISINMPKTLEQRKIARFLTLLEERITTQNKIIEKLQSLIKGIAAQLTQLEIPNVRLCDCLECHSSTLQENCVSATGSYPVYGATGLIGYTDSYAHNGESILIVKDGSGVGSLSYVNDHFSVIGTLNYLTAKEKYSSLYLYYALMAFNFTPYITGMAIPHIYFKDYGKAKLFCPSIEKQIRIASLLHNIEQKLVVEQNLIISLNVQKSYLLRMLFI